MSDIMQALDNYEPIAENHYLANVGRELLRLNADDPEMLDHAERVLASALAKVREQQREAHYERDG